MDDYAGLFIFTGDKICCMEQAGALICEQAS
jgi:hypothetical protein